MISEKKKNRTFLIFHIVILIFQLLSAFSICRQYPAVENKGSKIYVDGTDFTPLAELGTFLFNQAFSFFGFVIYSLYSLFLAIVPYSLFMIFFKRNLPENKESFLRSTRRSIWGTGLFGMLMVIIPNLKNKFSFLSSISVSAVFLLIVHLIVIIPIRKKYKIIEQEKN